MSVCPVCRQRSRDGHPCWKCWRKTDRRLKHLPDLWHELQATRRRLDHMSDHVGSRSATTGLPWNEAAAGVARRITDGAASRSGIVGWVRITADAFDASTPPEDEPVAMLRHLAACSHRLRLHESAAEFHADVWAWTTAIMQAVDPPEVRRVPAGPCPEAHEDAPCPGHVSLILPGRGFDAPVCTTCPVCWLVHPKCYRERDRIKARARRARARAAA